MLLFAGLFGGVGLMPLGNEIQTEVTSVLSGTWTVRTGQVVPESDQVLLAGGAVKLSAAVLYADLANSTELASSFNGRVAAAVVKAFLAASTRLIRARGGQVRSFDGDRVMGIFVGDHKNTSAMKCALNINWAVTEVIRPKITTIFPQLSAGNWSFNHAVGIDTSEVLTVRAGIRNNNDLIWVGKAPNVAAKLSSLREEGYSSYVTARTYNPAHASVKKSSDDRWMWESRTWNQGPIYRSAWRWSP